MLVPFVIKEEREELKCGAGVKYFRWGQIMEPTLKVLQRSCRVDQKKITYFLLRHNTDWLGLEFNTPTTSHMGGVWVRQIRSCCALLSSFLNNHGQSLSVECFRTVIAEVKSIVNSRLFSLEVWMTVKSLVPLTPNLLLTAKSKIVMAPPRNFKNAKLPIVKSTADNGGEEWNIWWTNFGANGAVSQISPVKGQVTAKEEKLRDWWCSDPQRRRTSEERVVSRS